MTERECIQEVEVQYPKTMDELVFHLRKFDELSKSGYPGA